MILFSKKKKEKKSLSAQFIGISYLFKLDWTAHNIEFRIIIDELTWIVERICNLKFHLYDYLSIMYSCWIIDILWFG